MKILIPDTTLIASMHNMEFKQGEIEKRGDPVIVPEYPWEEGHTYLYGSVMKRGAWYRMWYQSYVDRVGFFVNYARSRDGVKWEKPLINPLPSEGSSLYPTVTKEGERSNPFSKGKSAKGGKTNIVSTYHIPSVIYDGEDRAAPYKLFGYTDEGYRVAFSKDGIRFREYEKNPVIPLIRYPNPRSKKTWFNDVAPAFKDLQRNKFAAYVKTYIIDEQGRTKRSVGFSESDDFIRWSEPETIWAPSDADDRLAVQKGFKWADYYGLCGFNYGGIYLGFLWLFLIDSEFERGTHEGKIEVYLAYSLDGKKWDRISDAPFIPLADSGWESGMITTANAPLIEKDRTLIYYGGANISHGIGHKETPYDLEKHRFSTGVAFLENDRFVSLTSSKGSFQTKPLRSEKGIIQINADARKGRISIRPVQNGKAGPSSKMEGVDSGAFMLKSGVKGEIVLNVEIENANLYALETL